MVAVKSIFTVIATCSVFALFGQQRSVVVGLEGNTEYRRLIAEETAFVGRADSISAGMRELRANFRTDTLRRAENSAALLRMEEESFDIRTQMAHLAGRINAIEQDWILNSLRVENAPGGAPSGGQIAAIESRTTSVLVDSPFFAENLSPEQLAELRAAQKAEREIPVFVAQYKANHRKIKELTSLYYAAKTEAEAEKIRLGVDELVDANSALDARIDETWSTIFDSKGYIYNLTAEKQRLGELTGLWTRNLQAIRDRSLDLRNRCASRSVLDYSIAKPLLVFYEIELAQTIGNEAAADSLLSVGAALAVPATLAAELSPVRLRERSFIEYADAVQGGRTPVYSARNPVPDLAVHARGVVYKILVGAFASPQGLAVFRNFAPLAVWRPNAGSPDGKYRYLAGSYRTEAEALAAAEKLRRAGFRRPTVSAWVDGVHFDLSEPAADGGDAAYTIELTGIDELTPEIRSVVGQRDIAKSAAGFIVGPLNDAAAAIGLRLALNGFCGRGDTPDLSVKLTRK